MDITTTARACESGRRTRGARRTTRFVAVAVTAAAGLAGLAVAADPAAADVLGGSLTKDGCTVKVLAPVYHDTIGTGETRANFRFSWTCQSGRTMAVEQQGWDSDVGENSADDLVLDTSYSRSGVGSWNRYVTVKHWDGTGDPYVELYQRVRFRVTGGGITGSLSSWLRSPTTKYHV